MHLFCVEGTEDGVDGLVVVEGGEVDGDVGPLLVEGGAFGVEDGQGLAGFEDDAAGVEVAEACGQFGQGQFEIDDEAVSFEGAHGGFVIDDAAAGGDDGVFDVDAGDVVLFDLAEAGHAAGVDQFAEGFFAGDLDEDVGVEEIAAEALGEEDADGAFADAGHTDEDDVGFSIFYFRFPITTLIKALYPRLSGFSVLFVWSHAKQENRPFP